jgi:hypothetical protein
VRAQAVVLRHEAVTGRILVAFRQREAERLALGGEELMRNLNQDTRAIARQRVGAHGTAMLEVFENVQGVGHDLVRFAPLHVRDEADAARIAFERGVEQTLRLRPLVDSRALPLITHRRPQDALIRAIMAYVSDAAAVFV